MTHPTMKRCAALLLGLVALSTAAISSAAKPMRVGIIGCDTSHVIGFTKVINDPKAKGAVGAAKVIAAFPGGSQDIASSRDRVEGFTRQLKDKGIEIVGSIEQLHNRCDAYLLHSVDGRVHLEQFKKIAHGKPVFIDKPAAASFADVAAIFAHAEKTGTPCFSSSALRFCSQVQGIKKKTSLGRVIGAVASSPYKTEPHHPALYWYGIHGVESLYTLMGTGCESVTCMETDNQCVATGLWKDGRVGTFIGLKGKQGRTAFSATCFGSKQVAQQTGFDGYGGLVAQICEFFQTRQPPVTHEETLELYAFMQAASESLKEDGKTVEVTKLLESSLAK